MARLGDLLLRNRNFSLFWFAEMIVNFGERLNQMALIALVYHKAPGSALALAKLMSCTVIPVFLIGPVAGAWVDRWDKRDVLIISNVIRGLLALLMPLFLFLDTLLPIYVILFLIFSTTRFFMSGRLGIIPDLVSQDRLLMANSLVDSTRTIGTAVGVVAAGMIVNVRFIGASGGFFIYSLCYFAAAALIGMIVKKDFFVHVKDDLLVAKEALEKSIRKSLFSEIKEGMGFLFKYSDMRFVVAVFSLLMAAAGAIYCVVVVFVQEAFGTPTKDLSVLMLFLALGLFSGSLIYGKFGHKFPKKRVIFSSFAVSGLAIIAFTLLVRNWPDLLSACGASFAIGLVMSPVMITAYTLAHETMPEHLRGRVFSSLEAVIHLAFLAFMLCASVLAGYIDRAWILIISGAAFSAGGFAGLYLQERKKRAICRTSSL